MYVYVCMHIYIYIYILRLCNNCMLRPLRKANAETRRVFNKALKTEAHSPLCKLYIYTYIREFALNKAYKGMLWYASKRCQFLKNPE